MGKVLTPKTKGQHAPMPNQRFVPRSNQRVCSKDRKREDGKYVCAGDWYLARTYHIIQQNGNQNDKRILLLETMSALGIPPIWPRVRRYHGTGAAMKLGIAGCWGLLPLTMYPAVESPSQRAQSGGGRSETARGDTGRLTGED
jgi:hypothetical protein